MATTVPRGAGSQEDEAMDQPQGQETTLGYLAASATGGPGVLVIHAWWGLNGFFRALCDRLAAAGFVALAPDLFGGRTATTSDQARMLLRDMDGTAALATLGAAAMELQGHAATHGQTLGAVGFSLGAAYALVLSTTMPQALGAVVMYYGTEPDADYTAARAAYLGHYAPDDAWEPDSLVLRQTEALRGAGRAVTIERYPGARHWFAEENRPDDYHPEAARLAWQRTTAFLHRQLDHPPGRDGAG